MKLTWSIAIFFLNLLDFLTEASNKVMKVMQFCQMQYQIPL